MSMADKNTFTTIIRELESERNQALDDNKNLRSEVYRLTQDMMQTNHKLELARIEAEEMKQYYQDSQHLQEVLKKKEEKFVDLTKVVNYLKDDKAKLEAQMKAERASMKDAEREMYRLNLMLENKDRGVRSLEEQLYRMKELKVQNQHLKEQLSELTNNLHVVQMHKETLRCQLGNADKLGIELTERNRLLIQMEEEMKAERREKEDLLNAMRDMQEDMEQACLNQEKAEMQVNSLKKKVENLSSELTLTREENLAMRSNVEQIRQDIVSYQKSLLAKPLLSKPYDVSSGDHRSLTSSLAPSIRRTWVDQRDTLTPSLLYKRDRLNSFINTGHKEGDQMKEATNNHAILSKYTAKFRPSALGRVTDSARRNQDDVKDISTGDGTRRQYDDIRDRSTDKTRENCENMRDMKKKNVNRDRTNNAHMRGNYDDVEDIKCGSV